VAAARTAREAVAAQIAENTAARRAADRELGVIQARLTKYKDQLMEVKTNKEYTAMLHEIDRAKGDRDAVDTNILQAMEAADTLEAAIKQKESALAAEMKQVTAADEVLRTEQKDLESKRAGLDAERRGIEAQIAPEMVAEFNRISRSREGLAVVRVANGLCQGCSVRIQPRVIQQIRRNEGILRCESCKRFLYYLEEERAEPPAGHPG
jgi:predicted  nucleic acid-binding Zn-ribbon protein